MEFSVYLACMWLWVCVYTVYSSMTYILYLNTLNSDALTPNFFHPITMIKCPLNRSAYKWECVMCITLLTPYLYCSLSLVFSFSLFFASSSDRLQRGLLFMVGDLLIVSRKTNAQYQQNRKHYIEFYTLYIVSTVNGIFLHTEFDQMRRFLACAHVL